MSIASTLNGSYSLEALDRLRWPIAWSGTVPESERVAEETMLHELVAEAKRELEHAYTYWDLDEGRELEVRIVDGEITEICEV